MNCSETGRCRSKCSFIKFSRTGRVENQQTGQWRKHSGNPKNRQRSGQAAIIKI